MSSTCWRKSTARRVVSGPLKRNALLVSRRQSGSATVELSLLAETMMSAEGRPSPHGGHWFSTARVSTAWNSRIAAMSSLAGCTIRRMAGNGIIIDGGFRNQLVGCDIHTLGRLGSRIIGGDRPTLTPGTMSSPTAASATSAASTAPTRPAIQLEGVGNRVAHCLFENSPSSAMRVEGNDHLIEFNEFRKRGARVRRPRRHRHVEQPHLPRQSSSGTISSTTSATAAAAMPARAASASTTSSAA